MIRDATASINVPSAQIIAFGNHTSGTVTAVKAVPPKAEVIATASLPAAGAVQDGRIVIEDVAAGDRNLIIYAGGQRFRIDGGAAF